LVVSIESRRVIRSIIERPAQSTNDSAPVNAIRRITVFHIPSSGCNDEDLFIS